MIEFFEQFEFWNWLAMALVLIIVEITMIGAYFLLWIGGAAALVGVLMIFAPDMSWQAQLTIWALGSVAGIAGWTAYRKKNPPQQSDEPLLNQRGSQLVGRVLTLDVHLTANEQNRITVDDTQWSVESPADIKKGTQVKVTKSDSTVLYVEPAE